MGSRNTFERAKAVLRPFKAINPTLLVAFQQATTKGSQIGCPWFFCAFGSSPACFACLVLTTPAMPNFMRRENALD
jgi:hypothetical protein